MKSSRYVFWPFWALTLFGAWMGIPTAHAQAPKEFLHMVADINLSPSGSTPGSFVIFSNLLYFAANDGAHGTELWKYDGVTATRVTELSPGNAFSSISLPVVFNGAIYFRGSGTTNGNTDAQLWKYDGINATRITEIRPATGGFGLSGLTVFNNTLYFAANDGTNGNELWKYDGSNVSLAADINPGAGSSSPSSFCVYNGNLFFAASNLTTGVELWQYDGVTASLAADFNPGTGSSNPSGLIVFNGLLCFQATVPSVGSELFLYDPTEHGLAADINPGSASSNPVNFIVFNNALYFSANDGVNGTELWKYDGTNAPIRVTQINPFGGNANPLSLCVFNNALYFDATDSSTGAELWKFDGVNASQVADINPGSSGSTANVLNVYNGKLYFVATDGSGDRELWQFDGSTVSRALDINPGTSSSSPFDGIAFHDAYYFAAFPTNNAANNYFYKYDGTNVSVVSTTIAPSSANGIVLFNGALYFGTRKFDGTNFTSLSGSPLPSSVGEMRLFNNAIYFNGRDNTFGSELWKSDGTNMTRVTDIYPGSIDSNPLALTVFNNALYFMASDPAGHGLFKYDGTNVTRVGTMVLNTINGLLVYNGALYMGAATSGTDFEPWKYDGTNFAFLGEVNAFNTNATPLFQAVYHNLAYFTAYDGVHGNSGNSYQLWSCDGTSLTRLSNFVNGGLYLFTFNDHLYFLADDGITGMEFWRYDGTNFSLVADLNPGPVASGLLPTPISPFRNSYMLQASDGQHGSELWQMDALANVFRVTGISPQGGNLSVNWLSPGGWTNVLQAANGLGGTNSFSDCSPVIVTGTNGIFVTTNFVDPGAAGRPMRVYRLRLGP